MIGYFDNAATTYKKPEGMYEYMSDYMLSYGANVGRGSYESSVKSGKIVAETRSQILSLLKAPERKTVVFCSSATVALNTIIFGSQLVDGDVVYVSHFEHNAVLRPLYHLQSQKSISIKYLPMMSSNQFEYDLKEIEKSFAKDNPKMVIVSQVSNVFGAISPVEQIAAISKRYQSVMVVDAAQSCGIIDCDLRLIDYYVFAGHKTLLGPVGVGGFVCDRNTNLKPFVFGGTGIDSANKEMPITVPERFEAGTMNILSIVGLHYSSKWLLDNLQSARKLEKDNIDKLYHILSMYSFVKIVSPYPNVSSVISCKVSGFTSDEFGNILSERGISTRTGLHCAPKAHEFIGTAPEGLIRFSISPFTNDEDFRKLEEVLNELSSELV